MRVRVGVLVDAARAGLVVDGMRKDCGLVLVLHSLLYVVDVRRVSH